jgi:ribosomal protein L1
MDNVKKLIERVRSAKSHIRYSKNGEMSVSASDVTDEILSLCEALEVAIAALEKSSTAFKQIGELKNHRIKNGSVASAALERIKNLCGGKNG